MEEKNEIIIIADYAENSELTVAEICELCSISPEYAEHLIAYEIITPTRNHHFDLMQLKRLQAALRLHRDLDLNLAGVAMVLDLLDEVESLRSQAALFKKHF